VTHRGCPPQQTRVCALLGVFACVSGIRAVSHGIALFRAAMNRI